MTALPLRPRLGDFALARRHVARGETIVVVHDTRDGSILRLSPRQWAIVSCADGTRDVDGVMLAASRAGVYRRASEVLSLLASLADARLLVDGADGPDRAAWLEDATPAERPLDVLADYTFTCDGRGGCCAQYASIELLPAEALLARAWVPEVEDATTPLRGALDDGPRAAAMVDGCCVYLRADGRCAVHARGGAEAKPVSCRIYPRTFVDDGESVRVSIGVECACVLASVGGSSGEPLVPAGACTRGDLPRSLRVRALPERVAIDDAQDAPRAEIAAWSRAVARAVVSGDAAAGLWRLADAVARAGLDPAASLAALHTTAPPPPDAPERWLSALGRRAQAAANAGAEWRSHDDRLLGARRAIADALRGGAPRWSETTSPEEAFYVRAVLHGHQAAGVIPLARALRDRATRLLAARALRDAPYGLALVEAALRGGIEAYAREA